MSNGTNKSSNSSVYLLIIILIIALITNPDLEKHEDAVRNYYREKHLNLSDGSSGQAHIDKMSASMENFFSYFATWIEPKLKVGCINYYFFP